MHKKLHEHSQIYYTCQDKKEFILTVWYFTEHMACAVLFGKVPQFEHNPSCKVLLILRLIGSYLEGTGARSKC